jgi:hypothetical protein
MKQIARFIFFLTIAISFQSCKKDKPTDTNPEIKFVFTFDTTQARLDNLGNPSPIAPGNAAQHPDFKFIAAHYVELIPDPFTWLGDGDILFMSPIVITGGDSAIDFNSLTLASLGDTFLTVPLSQVSPGTYSHIRISVAYQQYAVDIRVDTTFSVNPPIGFNGFVETEVFSYLGFNNYIEYALPGQRYSTFGNRLQGFFGFETEAIAQLGGFQVADTGNAPQTTVVNPIQATSPIPPGSCLVTGEVQGLTITGSEQSDIVVEVKVSINNSFEWTDPNANGRYEPFKGEQVVDMGLRGMMAIVK